MNQALKKKVLISLTGSLVLLFAGLALFFYISRVGIDPPQLKDIHVDSQAAFKLNALEQISKKNGITEWQLKAASATLKKEKNKAILELVNIIFYTKDGRKVYLDSDQGILDTQTHDITFLKNVVVRLENDVLKTDKLHYTKKTHIIRSQTKVRVEDHASVITADSMTVDLNENKITLKGHVKGNLSETSQIP